ncbi:MAG: MnmC family methyltransferase [Candidatus Woesearchaeota archaeon]
MIVLSYFQIKKIEEAIKNNLSCLKVSLDLGISESEVIIKDNKVFFPNNNFLTFDQIRSVSEEKRFCFLLEDNSLKRITIFSDETKLFYKLLPTEEAPTFEISGIRMHCLKETKPFENAKRTVNFLKPKGVVLDTCTGLGYTAINIARKKNVTKVFTVEKDRNVIELMKFNPWSQELFSNNKIRIIFDTVESFVKKSKDKTFDAIMHDPPSLKIAPGLYSKQLYKDFYRILKSNGRLCHYIGRPGIKKGLNFESKTIRRLREAGFKKIIKNRETQSLLALKH